MQTVSWRDLEDVTKEDIGKVVLMNLSGPILSIQDTLEECIAEAERNCGDTIDRDSIDDHTDFHYLTTADLVAAEIAD